MKAKYIGEDYNGFKKDTIYEIEAWCENITGKSLTKPTPCLCVKRVNSTDWCPYSRLETFLKNWVLVE